MTRYEELLSAITTNPEDDAARLAFAAHLRSSEPDRAQFIERQVAQARARRQARGPRANVGDPGLSQHEAAWSRTIAKYATSWTFDRGFITAIRIDPHLFLEYAEWLFLNAPIRVVELAKPEDGPFPMAELADSPFLARLDRISLQDERLTRGDLERLARSKHLDRLLGLGAVGLQVPGTVYEAFAANPQLRKLLSLGLSNDGFPGERYEDTGQDDLQGRAMFAWTDLAPAGKALEARHGYLPWLHHENLCEPFDAAWFVAQGILPVKPPGSPAGGN
jgi:uncharacterized protein (TIGR02996 family)